MMKGGVRFVCMCHRGEGSVHESLSILSMSFLISIMCLPAFDLIRLVTAI